MQVPIWNDRKKMQFNRFNPRKTGDLSGNFDSMKEMASYATIGGSSPFDPFERFGKLDILIIGQIWTELTSVIQSNIVEV